MPFEVSCSTDLSYGGSPRKHPVFWDAVRLENFERYLSLFNAFFDAEHVKSEIIAHTLLEE
jgi:hypothetical protein